MNQGIPRKDTHLMMVNENSMDLKESSEPKLFDNNIINSGVQMQKLTLERDQLKDQLRKCIAENQKVMDSVLSSINFVKSQKFLLIRERDMIASELEKVNAEFKSIVAQLEESKQINGQKEIMRLQLLNDLKTQEQLHLQEIDKQKKRLKDFKSIICSICLETFNSSPNNSADSLSCGHIFHKLCLQKYLNNEYYLNCPICRYKDNIDQIRPIFF